MVLSASPPSPLAAGDVKIAVVSLFCFRDIPLIDFVCFLERCKWDVVKGVINDGSRGGVAHTCIWETMNVNEPFTMLIVLIVVDKMRDRRYH